MKIKQHLVITNPLDFFAGKYHDCFTLYETKSSVRDWVNVGEIEIEVPDELVEQSQAIGIKALDEAEKVVKKEYTQSMARIDIARQELLCLTDQSAA